MWTNRQVNVSGPLLMGHVQCTNNFLIFQSPAVLENAVQQGHSRKIRGTSAHLPDALFTSGGLCFLLF